jgi:hypothetical protein
MIDGGVERRSVVRRLKKVAVFLTTSPPLPSEDLTEADAEDDVLRCPGCAVVTVVAAPLFIPTVLPVVS